MRQVGLVRIVFARPAEHSTQITQTPERPAQTVTVNLLAGIHPLPSLHPVDS